MRPVRPDGDRLPLSDRLFEVEPGGAPAVRADQGHPLRTWEPMLAYLRGTTTETGLSVTADLHKAVYQKGQKVSEAAMAQLNLEPHTVCPQWNYTVRPRSAAARTVQPTGSGYK